MITISLYVKRAEIVQNAEFEIDANALVPSMAQSVMFTTTFVLHLQVFRTRSERIVQTMHSSLPNENISFQNRSASVNVPMVYCRVCLRLDTNNDQSTVFVDI